MANTPQPQRQDEPAVTDADLDALLAGEADAIPGLRPVADVLTALAAGPTAGELAGETRTLAEFRRRTGAPVPRQRARRGTAVLPSRLGAKIGAAATAVAIVLGGAATAAFANALPAPIQRLAHDAFGAPTPQPRRDLPGHGAPGAHGERAHGQAAAHGEPRGGRQARPHATAAPTPPGNAHPKGQQGNPHSQGQQGNPHGHGKHGKPSGQGQQGNGQGQGQGNGQGQQGNGQGNQGNGQGQQGNGKGKQANEQGGNGYAAAQHGNFHGKGLRGGRPAHHRPAGTRAGPYIPKPAMDP
jgi:hypothetical protein